MDHSYFTDRLSAYSDNELKNEEYEALRQHVETCDECRLMLTELEKLDQFAGNQDGLAESDYWESAAQKIEARISGQQEAEVTTIEPSRWKGLGWKLVAAAASVAVLTFIGINQSDIEQDVSDLLEAPTIVLSGDVDEDNLPTDSAVSFAPRYNAGDDGGAMRSLEDLSATSPAAPDQTENAIAGSEKEETSFAVDGLEAGDLDLAEKAKLAIRTKDRLSAPAASSKKAVADDIVKEAKSEVLSITTKSAESLTVRGGRASEVGYSELAEIAAEVQPVMRQDGQLAETASDEMVIADSVDRSVEYWRSELASLTMKLDTKSITADFNKVAKPSRLGGKAKSPITDSVGLERERKVLESHYQIALLTKLEGEREKSVKYLRRYLKKPEPEHRELVEGYLEELGFR